MEYIVKYSSDTVSAQYEVKWYIKCDFGLGEDGLELSVCHILCGLPWGGVDQKLSLCNGSYLIWCIIVVLLLWYELLCYVLMLVYTCTGSKLA